MNTPIKIFLAVTISIFGFTNLYAQNATSTTQTSTSEENTIVITKNGDELCVLSSGDQIPCIWKTAAEQDIKQMAENGGYRRPIVNGVKFCPVIETGSFLQKIFNPAGYHDCKYFESNGDIKFQFYVDNYWIVMSAFFFTLLVIVLAAFRIKDKRIKFITIFIILILLGAYLIEPIRVFADIPSLPTNTFACSCVTSSTQTCVTNGGLDDGTFSGDGTPNPLPANVRISCHGGTNVYNVKQKPTWSAACCGSGNSTGNYDFANIKSINLAANQFLTSNMNTTLNAATQNLSGWYINEGAYPPGLGTNNWTIGYNTGVVCYRQGASGTLKFTGYSFESGGPVRGNGTGGMFARGNFSCY
jgi:hypothetical protein